LINRLTPFIIRDMRLFVLALMMVLLPLRGWTGDAMATDMASQQMYQTTASKADAHEGHQNHEAHSNHANHETLTEVTASSAHGLSHADFDQTHDADHSAGTCESCSVCQACHNVALLLTSDDLKPFVDTLWTPTELADPYASADAALDQKPPIS